MARRKRTGRKAPRDQARTGSRGARRVEALEGRSPPVHPVLPVRMARLQSLILQMGVPAVLVGRRIEALVAPIQMSRDFGNFRFIWGYIPATASQHGGKEQNGQ